MKIDDLSARCVRLETTLLESTKELLKERKQKQNLEVLAEELQTNVEQRIKDIRNNGL